MSMKINVLDLTSLNLELEIPEKTTVSQLATILQEKHNINAKRCTFASNGKQLEPETVLDETILQPKNIITMVNDAVYPIKSFPRAENLYPNQGNKFANIFQKQPEHSGKKGRSSVSEERIRHEIISRFFQLLGSSEHRNLAIDELGNEILNVDGISDILQHYIMPENRQEDNDEDLTSNTDYENEDYDDDEEDDDDSVGEENEDDIPMDAIRLPFGENIVISHGDGLANRNFDGNHRQFFFSFNPQTGGFNELDLIGQQNLNDAMNELPPEIQGLEQILSQEQRDAVSRICNQTGVDRPTVLQIYEACDHNEDLTTNCLMSMA